MRRGGKVCTVGRRWGGPLAGALGFALLACPAPASWAQVPTTERVSFSASCCLPALSADGRFVAFSSFTRDPNTNGVENVFVRDRAFVVTTRVSVATGGAQANGGSSSPAISADGRFVAFASEATNLVAGDTNGATDVFVRDLLTFTTERVSVATGGVQANGFSFRPAISAAGRFVAFVSSATNLVPGDTNPFQKIF